MNLDDILAAKELLEDALGDKQNGLDREQRSIDPGDVPSEPVINTTADGLAICQHIKPSGERCGSPALRDEKFCYYHVKVRKTVPQNNLFVFLNNPGRKENDPYNAYEFPYLEDPAALQIGFMQLIYAVSQGRIEQWRARMILSALHGAAANLRLMDKAESAKRTVEAGRQAAGWEAGGPCKKQPARAGSVEEGEETA